MIEWKVNKNWNPFNSCKYLAHVDRWSFIEQWLLKMSDLPAPVCVVFDPTNKCNLKCEWCNSKYIIQKNNQEFSEKELMDLAYNISVFKTHNIDRYGRIGEHTFQIRSICIAGGGEPLLNPNIGKFIDVLIKNGIDVGVITNGVLIDRFIENLSKCTWIGVSIDAGTAKTFQNLKGKNYFNKVILNIIKLIEYSKNHNTALNSKLIGKGITYKYLLHPKNINELVNAADLAKDIGCRNFHVRPISPDWTNLKNRFGYNTAFIKKAFKEMERIHEYEDEMFNIFTIKHKFDDEFKPFFNFKKCWASLMTMVIMPARSNQEICRIGFCPDRRGDERVEIKEPITSIDEIFKYWGSKHHFTVFKNIDFSDCPRCTFQPHNQIFESIVLGDSMTHNFL